MENKTYQVRFKAPRVDVERIEAALVDVHEGNLFFVDSQHNLVALFRSEQIESWAAEDEFASLRIASEFMKEAKPMTEPKMYPVEEAVKAHKALRAAIGLGPEMFPIGAFVGMISDEVELLRKRGKTDGEIAQIIRDCSSIDISPAEIAENYATPEERHRHDK